MQSYTEDEITFTAQVHEPPLQYHYQAPHTLVPLTTEAVPVPRYLDAAGQPLPDDAPNERDCRERSTKSASGPASATSRTVRARCRRATAIRGAEPRTAGRHRAHRRFRRNRQPRTDRRRLHLEIKGWRTRDCTHRSSAHDGRAHHRPQELPPAPKRRRRAWVTTTGSISTPFLCAVSKGSMPTPSAFAFAGKYPQFLYWLAMPFFAPVPREVDRFYSQPGMAEKEPDAGLVPVGTGPCHAGRE